jgi:diamine N-acetyltransferase
VEEGRLREAVRAGDGYDNLIVLSMLDREYAARVGMGLDL